MAAPDIEEAFKGLKSAILSDPTTHTAQEVKLLLDECTDALNDMSNSLIRFSIAWIALKNKMDTPDHPTLFDDKDSTP